MSRITQEELDEIAKEGASPPDPEKLYAGELRERGFPIPENIPDCAWIPRWALVPVVGSVEVEKVEGDTLSLGFQFKFLEPFKWVETTVEISTGGSDG